MMAREFDVLRGAPPRDLVGGYGAPVHRKKARPGWPSGERKPNAKLTKVLAEAILDLREEHGYSYRQILEWLADWHGVAISKRTLRGILAYERWTSYPDMKR